MAAPCCAVPPAGPSARPAYHPKRLSQRVFERRGYRFARRHRAIQGLGAIQRFRETLNCFPGKSCLAAWSSRPGDHVPSGGARGKRHARRRPASLCRPAGRRAGGRRRRRLRGLYRRPFGPGAVSAQHRAEGAGLLHGRVRVQDARRPQTAVGWRLFRRLHDAPPHRARDGDNRGAGARAGRGDAG